MQQLIFAFSDFQECYVCRSRNETYPGGGKDEVTYRDTACEVNHIEQHNAIPDHNNTGFHVLLKANKTVIEIIEFEYDLRFNECTITITA